MKDRAELVERIVEKLYPQYAPDRERINAELTAIQDAGYVLVPGEPDEKAIALGSLVIDSATKNELRVKVADKAAKNVYKAMISASPLRDRDDQCTP